MENNAVKRKRDAFSEIKLLCTLFPEIKTGTVSHVTGRDPSFCSRVIREVRKSSGEEEAREREDVTFSEPEGKIASYILKKENLSEIEIAYILEISINNVTKWLKEDNEYVVRRCEGGHTFFARADISDCPMCKPIIPPDMEVGKKRGRMGKRDKKKFSTLFFKALSAINKYYTSRRNNSTPKCIKEFKAALGWIKFGNVTTEEYTIPFDAGCEMVGLNPILEREKIFNKIIRKEKRLKDGKTRNKIPILDNVDDIFEFASNYVELKSGLANRRATCDYEPISNRYPFLQALQS